jgi:DNA-binding MarR family transcriptional regulator
MGKTIQKIPIPAPAQGKRGETGHVAYLLRQAGAALRLKLERSFSAFEITPPQFSALTMIAAYPPLSGADLARLTLLTPQTVNVIVRNLIRRGAVTAKPDAVHGRILRLEITPKGRRLLAKCKAAAARVETRLVAGLSRQAQKTIRAWLAGIARDLPS